MFKVTPNGINRLDIQLSGKLNAEDMKIALDELVGKSKHLIETKKQKQKPGCRMSAETAQALKRGAAASNMFVCVRVCLWLNDI